MLKLQKEKSKKMEVRVNFVVVGVMQFFKIKSLRKELNLVKNIERVYQNLLHISMKLVN